MRGINRFIREEKAEIILLYLRNTDKISKMCREKGIAPVTYTKGKSWDISEGIDAMSRSDRVGQSRQMDMAKRPDTNIDMVHVACDFSSILRKIS